MYDQLQRVLLRSIEDGTLQPGDMLPSEYQLCRLHDVSRTVVRQALGLLEHEGMIVRTKGKGTYVAPRKTSRSEEHTSELQSRGHLVCRLLLEKNKSDRQPPTERQSTSQRASRATGTTATGTAGLGAPSVTARAAAMGDIPALAVRIARHADPE